ncbi:MAG: M23 family metallopeptidase [bacterium]|nr:M23 family metallopeptidase [bacterium]
MTSRAWGVIALLALAIVAGTSVWLRCEGIPPDIRAPQQIVIGRGGTELNLGASDPRSGVRELTVRLRHAGGEATVFHESYPGTLPTGAVTKPGIPDVLTKLDPKTLGLKEGEAFLVIEATDWSWASMLAGNTRVLEIPVRVDLKAPRVSVETGLTYVRRAGSASVVYRVNEDVSRDGVEVGEAFFDGMPLPGATDGRRISIFAVPRNAPANVPIRVIAEDAAGNRGTGSWATRLQERSFEEVPIRLGQGFLTGKVPELADALELDASDPVAAFQHINRDVRATNEAEIRRIVARATPELAFEGRFLQMRGSAVTSRFAEHRSYLVEGKKVSEAIHYGYDLASTAGAGIEAANAGRVLFADALGIYGNCVILDHGLGVTSLYGHLSRIDVGAGDVVTRGQTLGTSGATGLAGGDHLHFAILVGDTYVDPKEWWDAKWVRDHIEARLELGQ